MATGYDDTNLRNTAYLKIMESVINRSVFRDKDYFEHVPAAMCPGGSTIQWLINYGTTSNGGFMSSYADAAPTPDDMASITAYQNKDYVQHTALVYDILINQLETGFNGSKVEGVNQVAMAMQNAAQNLATTLSGRYIADLTAMLDSADTFGDGALVRATYNLATYEDGGGAMTSVMLDNAVEALCTAAYGGANPSTDLFWIMSPNQVTNLSRLSGGLQYLESVVSDDSASPIDASRRHRIATYSGIPIMVDPAVTVTTIFLLRKGTVKIFDHQPLTIKELAIHGQQQEWLISMGSNLVVTNPKYNAVLKTVTE